GNCFRNRDRVASASLFDRLDPIWTKNDGAPAAVVLASDGLAGVVSIPLVAAGLTLPVVPAPLTKGIAAAAEASVRGLVGGRGTASSLSFDTVVVSDLTDTVKTRCGVPNEELGAARDGSGGDRFAATIGIVGGTGIAGLAGGAGLVAAATTD